MMAVCACEPGICYCLQPEEHVNWHRVGFRPNIPSGSPFTVRDMEAVSKGWHELHADPIRDIQEAAKGLSKSVAKIADTFVDFGNALGKSVKVLQPALMAMHAPEGAMAGSSARVRNHPTLPPASPRGRALAAQMRDDLRSTIGRVSPASREDRSHATMGVARVYVHPPAPSPLTRNPRASQAYLAIITPEGAIHGHLRSDMQMRRDNRSAGRLKT